MTGESEAAVNPVSHCVRVCLLAPGWQQCPVLSKLQSPELFKA